MYARGFGDLGPSLTFTKVGGGSAASFTVGQSWQIDITGPANQTVWVIANGSGPVSIGTTDANGRFSKSSAVGAGDVGKWGELWYVGPSTVTGVFVGSLSFEVVAAPQTSSSATNTTPVPPTSPGLPPTGVVCGSGYLQLGDTCIPSWALFAGAGLALVLMLGGRR